MNEVTTNTVVEVDPITGLPIVSEGEATQAEATDEVPFVVD